MFGPVISLRFAATQHRHIFSPGVQSPHFLAFPGEEVKQRDFAGDVDMCSNPSPNHSDDVSGTSSSMTKKRSGSIKAGERRKKANRRNPKERKLEPSAVAVDGVSDVEMMSASALTMSFEGMDSLGPQATTGVRGDESDDKQFTGASIFTELQSISTPTGTPSGEISDDQTPFTPYFSVPGKIVGLSRLTPVSDYLQKEGVISEFEWLNDVVDFADL